MTQKYPNHDTCSTSLTAKERCVNASFCITFRIRYWTILYKRKGDLLPYNSSGVATFNPLITRAPKSNVWKRLWTFEGFLKNSNLYFSGNATFSCSLLKLRIDSLCTPTTSWHNQVNIRGVQLSGMFLSYQINSQERKKKRCKTFISRCFQFNIVTPLNKEVSCGLHLPPRSL